eukprot:TRINITY_DN38670_c0_g1_i1.p1 TRINITY_DN38670_c0_g1~~TRINITY_DN38670_c0_g1_i1.p1  ORF type:complete len:712 (-),score=84.11 TRINITY_DN38670_c0_g1_i1:35-2170(-)
MTPIARRVLGGLKLKLATAAPRANIGTFRGAMEDRIRSATSLDSSRLPLRQPLRFGIDDMVMVHIGKGRWELARICDVNFQDPKSPHDEAAPYRVEISQVGFGVVPVDDARIIRKAEPEEVQRIRQTDQLLEDLRPRAQNFKQAQLDAAADRQDHRPDLAAALRYHAESCHLRPGEYAKGGAMDWNNQPDKFRRVLGAPSLDLKQSGPATELHDMCELPDLQALGTLLHDACGITAWKQHGRAKWSLRANPSSGALQPLEVHVIGRVGAEAPAHWHYNPFWHSIERVAPVPAASWEALMKQLPRGAVIIGITRIVWRNAWKYGDPGFRYTHHDVGHLMSSFAFAAAAQHATVVLLDSLTDNELADVLRPDAPEEPVCFLAVFPSAAVAPSGEWWRHVRLGEGTFWGHEREVPYHGAPVEAYYGKPEVEARPLIAAAHAACWRSAPPEDDYWKSGAPPLSLHSAWTSAGPLRPLIHTRRSAVSYNAKLAPPGGLQRSIFDDIVRRMLHQPVWFPWRAGVQPVIFVHRVAGLERGVYLLCRDREVDELRASFDPMGQFAWTPATATPSDIPLVLLRDGDVIAAAKLASCEQDIASESAFAVAFLAEHLPALERYGSWWYPRAHWEACALGGALYLAAGAAGPEAGLQATGIGCFFAPWVHALLGVDTPQWADVYHFTVGWPDTDERVDMSLPPYHHVESLRGRDRDTISSRGF